jgi:phosphoribosylanthranilate isomerase
MVNPIIKICGIRDAEMAENAAKSGANLIGIVFHPSSLRHVSLEQAIAISNATRKAGASPVAVFVDQNDIEMRTICEAADIQIVQLHGRVARAHHHLLPNTYQRIYVLNNTEQRNDDGFQYLESTRDIILIDHDQPGHGKMNNFKDFRYSLPFPWIVAGGLNPSNVATLIDQLQPNGVDVSSGVEITKGQKDILLIQQFISAARGYDEF